VRPGSKLCRKVKIGNFVEVKNAVLGEGTKSAHLTYIGDADVGANVNFGCGVVVVNYDGWQKHRTTVGDNVFLGCNTNLVAPVKVGDNSYTAAGSTVTKDVPPDSLVIARAPEVLKEGRIKQMQEKFGKK
jgi:bifunctional UDP-N-acetylglucosamine pyrophosphorylase/glucosamine-1-phosphate N-acetyltransferase